MNLKILLEKFKGSLKNRQGQYTEVFVNPSKKEMDQVGQSASGNKTIYRSKGSGNHLRFIATEDKKLYVFPPYTLHREVVEKFNIPAHPNALEGIAEKQGNVWKLVETHDLEKDVNDIKYGFAGATKKIKNYIVKDWSWLNKWIQINPYWNNTLKELGKEYGFKALTKKLITEEFKKGFKHPDTRDYIEVFTNPSAKEISQVIQKLHGKKYFRFIANNEKKEIYIFSPTLVHRKASGEIGGAQGPKNYEMWGVAEKTKKGWEVITSDILEYGEQFKENLININWDWLKKWVDVSPLIEKLDYDEPTDSSKLEPKNFGNIKKVEECYQQFFEEFKASFKDYKDNYIEVFINPTHKEMLSVSTVHARKKYIRFITNKNDIYIFKPEIFHSQVYGHLRDVKKEKLKEPGKQLWGTAKLVKDKWIFDGSDKNIPENFNWENLATRGIMQNKKIEVKAEKNILGSQSDFASKRSIYPDDFLDRK